jgi:uncharacterized Zn-binding protein involved in type VI secretion
MLSEIREVVGGSLELSPEMLEAVPKELRAQIAARYSERPTVAAISSPDRREESATQPGVSHESSSESEAVVIAPRSRRWAVAAVAVALPLVGVMVWGLSGSDSRGVREPGAQASGTSRAPETTVTASAAAVDGDRTVHVSVEPASARVSVDGMQFAVDGGRIALRGRLGSVHEIVASVGPREARARVVITEAGALPSEINVPASRTEVPRRSPRAAPPAAPRPTAAPEREAAPAPTPKPPEHRPQPNLTPTESFE